MLQDSETLNPQPIFNPDNVGQSIDQISAVIPLRNRLLRGLRSGQAIASVKGIGSEIDGTRDYIPGDDSRHIDWRLSARSPDETLKIREHYNEIKPTLWIVTDALGPRYDTKAGYFSERDLALSAIVALIRVAERQRMPYGVVAANEQQVFLPKRRAVSGRKQILPTINRLVGLMDPSETAVSARSAKARSKESKEQLPQSIYLQDALEQAGRLCTQNVVTIVSDFRDVVSPDDPNHGWQTAIRNLYRRKQNQIIAIETTNPWDFELPERADRFTLPGGAVYLGGKAGQAVRQRYEDMAQDQQEAINQTLQEVQAQHITLSTANPQWLTSLESQLREKRNHRAA